MRQHRVWAAALLLGGSALLLAPANSSAQMMFGGGWTESYRTSPFYSGWTGNYRTSPFYGYYPSYSSYGFSPYNWGYGAPSAYSYYPRSYWYGNNWSAPGYAWNNYNWANPAYAYSWGGYYSPTVFSSDNYFNPASTAGNFGNSYNAAGYYSYGARATSGPRDSAVLNVRLPDANAQVWVEGDLTRQRGTWREFVSPPLDPNKNYTYDVRARWTENGREVERTRTIPVRANAVATVDFTTADSSAARGEDIDRGGKAAPADTTRPGTTAPRTPDTTRPGPATPPGNTPRTPDTTKPGGTVPPDRP
jgi:uncharacterized protein (TIGR03000 family)